MKMIFYNLNGSASMRKPRNGPSFVACGLHVFSLTLCCMLALSSRAFCHDLGGGCTARILSFAYVHEDISDFSFGHTKVVLSAEYSGCAPGTLLLASIDRAKNDRALNPLSYSYLYTTTKGTGRFPNIEYQCKASSKTFPVEADIFTASKYLAQSNKTIACGM